MNPRRSTPPRATLAAQVLRDSRDRPVGVAVCLALLLATLLLATPLRAQTSVDPCTIDRLTPTPGASADGLRYGSGVAIDGDTIVIGIAGADDAGIDSGALEVRSIDPSGATTTFVQTLVPLTLGAGDALGSSIALDGDHCIAGAPLANFSGPASGSARVFERNSVTGLWSESSVLVANDAQTLDEFGHSVSISGDVALVGAPLEDSAGAEAGAAYVFRRDPVSGQWLQEEKLVGFDSATGDRFGSAVAIEGDVAVVGALGPGFGAGAAYVYRYQPIVGLWTFEEKLLPTGLALLDQFAHALDISGGRIVACSLRDDTGGPDSGSCTTFVLDAGSGSWVEEQTILSPDAAAGDLFGFSVALDGDRLVVGAVGDDPEGVGSGAAYAFRRDPIAGWTFLSELFDEPEGLPDDAFGAACAIDGDRSVVAGSLHDGVLGTDSGVVRVFLGDAADCNDNGISDLCDLLSGTSPDLNGNGIPDECDYVAPVVDLACTVTAGETTITWLSGEPYDAVRVSIDGDAPLVLAGSATSLVVPGLLPGFHTIAVTGLSGLIPSASTMCTVTVLPTPVAALTCTPGDRCLLDVSLVWTGVDPSLDATDVTIDGIFAVSLPPTATALDLTLFEGSPEICLARRIDAVDPDTGLTVTLTSDPVCCTPTIVGIAPLPPTGVTCTVDPVNCVATITWTAAAEYSQVELLLDGVSTQVLAGDEGSATVAIPAGGSVDACLRATTICGELAPDVCCALTCGPAFVRGDANADANLDIADAISVLFFLFSAGSVACEASVDANADLLLDISDAIYTLDHLFLDGPAPPAPFPGCGTMSTPFSCIEYTPCP